MEELSIADEMADDVEDGLVDNIATTSIMHNFIVSNPESVAKFAKALEEAFNDPPRPITVDVKFLDDPDEIREFMERRRAHLQRKRMLEASPKATLLSSLQVQANAAETDNEEEERE